MADTLDSGDLDFEKLTEKITKTFESKKGIHFICICWYNTQ